MKKELDDKDKELCRFFVSSAINALLLASRAQSLCQNLNAEIRLLKSDLKNAEHAKIKVGELV